ncbi:hypothetical protein KFE96_09605 [Kordiimonas sp. SCSIO 12603]|uniref:S41 family peptidase n=1 Tax=Kordiimonas sp. SCSIO 12603 TaxID=2829596 RepID=UPI0021046E0D|nr:S41 family peptidase [Kordiimonas sp. SCSIO 12603]UTW57122.1 hypothetical protein KFE96_09605 [Kordiimonas sp. SCSIO 12603]
MRRTAFSLMITACFLTGCSEPHLEIFPPLDDPALIEKKIAPVDLREDIDAFYFGALERHPDLVGYADIPALEALSSSLKANITKPLTRLEFFRTVGQLTHTFGDGHSMLIWPYQEYERLQETGNKPFPFRVHIDQENQLLIKNNYQTLSGENITAGSRITAINGISAETLIDSMQRYVGGETEYLRKQFVAARFPIYIWAVHDVMNDFTLNLETENGGTYSLAISKNQAWQEIGETEEESRDFYYKNLGNNTAYLHVGHFDIDPDWFEEFIDEAFESYTNTGATSLVVDVRANTGGNTDTALYLSRYLANKPFRMVSKVREKLNSDNRGWFNYKGNAGDIIDTDWDDWIDPMPEGKRFRGEKYVLISPITYSSGIVFASTMKDFSFATLIGQETGGNANQTAQGNLFNLPHSQLRAYITTRMLVRPSGANTPGGIKPDYEVHATQASLQAGEDVELNQALELIRSK